MPRHTKGGPVVASDGAGLALELRDVSKVYRGRVHALRGIDLEVGRGEVFGLLGPNGAGKSTLIKILMTVIRPTTCSGHMLGRAIGSKSTLKRVGYLPENHKFPAYLTGRQALDFYGAMSCVPRGERRRRADELLELVGMADWAGSKIGGYSKGMRQRIGIAQALINDPELVLLDEPTDGVDPGGRRDIRAILSHMRSEGRTVFINSHILSELEQVCDR
ncbi:MAG: ABC transporter ATP-binding protein, partial [Phycisphaerales bacterium]|nr:ABC transporter ATP-binding protein [Phycisphaerales bacterium]